MTNIAKYPIVKSLNFSQHPRIGFFSNLGLAIIESTELDSLAPTLELTLLISVFLNLNKFHEAMNITIRSAKQSIIIIDQSNLLEPKIRDTVYDEFGLELIRFCRNFY